MTSLADLLGAISQAVRGCHTAFAMDYDGLPLEAIWPGAGGPPDLVDAIGAEFAAVLREARQAAQDLGLGPLQSVSVRAQGPSLVFRCGQDSLLVAVVDRTASAAVARRALAEAGRHELPAL